MADTTQESIQRHIDHLGRMSRPGGSLRSDAATATTANPAWFALGSVAMPTVERVRLHDRILAEFRAEKEGVLTDRKAIVLAGPPGAGKSTVLGELVQKAGGNMGQWRVVDADHFKDMLLREADADGSYDSWIVPADVRALEAAGERFYPRELASLVHVESARLAVRARSEAINAGERLVVDTVLSSPAAATSLGRTLEAAGYDVTVVEVEVPLELSRERTQNRWRDGYLEAERGVDGSELGGRWVPSEYPESLYTPGASTSTCLDAAKNLAASCPVVSRFEQHDVDPSTGKPRPTAVQVRRAPGGPLVFERTANAYSVAMDGVARPGGRPARPQSERDGRSR